MATVNFHFHTELNFFLPTNKRNVTYSIVLSDSPSIKDAIESQGVPHPEVALILVNGESVDFSYLLQDGDEINVYPISELTNNSYSVSVEPEPLSTPCFVLDVHLGKLASSLRMLGFDTLYRNDYDDEELAEISSREKRILLTRDTGLLKRSIVTYGYYVRQTNPQKQLIEVIKRFDLKKAVNPFKRCITCNGLLAPIAKETILEQIPPKVRESVDEFHSCQDCKQVFWRGSHYDKMRQFVDEVLG
ncbi:Mut7-C ubiquitin/RNAse domain-containing protein [Planktothrix sp. FACHB-1355]|uniref:Mut7-C ubiquitin/RNAse domain-containing protein n=1 Tax=Aerosakkonema funiforme FACHB-1375 TaxID=2949571 RepID=A0A926VKP9_9CYAN|nr:MULTISPECIES: Mut7-C RNAse domain-containing protein [Oscillatoriales]MBD2184199.1 Mut7-C ubiquitin/RNAse domain-containing protein [Aerosakkonema funiforme FACHB-1375]MBD3560903.1 Mut7-C ubiquitin/RNAse domain-containing protein [Planktothrix sp. FACHB-1355]